MMPPPRNGLHFGWVVLAATFYLNLVVDGYCFIFGILRLYIKEDYPDHSAWTISIIGGIVRTIYLVFAPICIAVNEFWGPTRVIICASLISATAFILCWLNTFFQVGFYFDLLMLGIFQGVASALLYGPSIAVIATYFPQHQRAFASGITTCGSPVGAIIYSLIIPPLFEGYGWRGSLLFFAGLSLNGIVFSLAFMKRFKPKEANSQSLESNSETFLDVLKRFFNAKLLFQPSFLCILGAAIFSIAGYFVPMLLVTAQSRNPEWGVSVNVQKNLVLMWGVSNAIGRVVSGRLGDLGLKYVIFTSYWIFIIGHVVSAITLLIFPHLMFLGDVAFVTFVFVYGFFIAPLVTMRSVIVAELYGKVNAGATFGWFLFIQGIVQIPGFVLPTWLDSIAALYAYVFGATCFLLASIFAGLTLKPYFAERKKTKENRASGTKPVN